ncbi:response regulator [Patescibacteria group bacterium]|nr:response regulator [Patescibacteria group bacterium]MBU0963725.1 response regulator [Patescibacteria group bacterium]
MADNKKVLIIEDEESIRIALRKTFAGSDILLLEAENGEVGLELAFKEHPDLIILDIVMPKMHGIDALDKLQADEKGKNIPILILTNYADDPRVKKAVDMGRAEMMSKTDCHLEDVVKKVKEKLGTS